MDRSSWRWIPFKNSPIHEIDKSWQVVFVKGRWMGGCFHSGGLFGVSVIIARSCGRHDHNIAIIIGNSIICQVSFWQLNVDILGACNYYFGYLDISLIILLLLWSFHCQQLLACCRSKSHDDWGQIDFFFFFPFFFKNLFLPTPSPPFNFMSFLWQNWGILTIISSVFFLFLFTRKNYQIFNVTKLTTIARLSKQL